MTLHLTQVMLKLQRNPIRMTQTLSQMQIIPTEKSLKEAQMVQLRVVLVERLKERLQMATGQTPTRREK